MKKLEFKLWIEERFKGLSRIFRQENPNLPDYVRNDLYHNRIAPVMQKLSGQQSSGTEEKISPSSGHKRSPLDQTPSDSVSKIMQAAKLQGAVWTPKPIILTNTKGTIGVTPNDFSIKTQRYMLDRLFGYKTVKVRDDAARTAKQKELISTGKQEPVIVKQTLHGYELLEGWHRTMNLLLLGAPQDQLEALQKNQPDLINFTKWQPVQIKAYVGSNPDIMRALAGTGDY